MVSGVLRVGAGVVPPEALVNGTIDWDHPGIIFVYIDTDQDLRHLKTAVRINGAHNGFSHRLMLGTDLVGVDGWLELAKESAGQQMNRAYELPATSQSALG